MHAHLWVRQTCERAAQCFHADGPSAPLGIYCSPQTPRSPTCPPSAELREAEHPVRQHTAGIRTRQGPEEEGGLDGGGCAFCLTRMFPSCSEQTAGRAPSAWVLVTAVALTRDHWARGR